ncbi:MAG: D-sedoheptulose 7-phosphate isomerase [Planctomycetes bacterium]|nr:D-sedoheptulose 7-phosphate isomerase [Planctomycetota bacterium]
MERAKERIRRELADGARLRTRLAEEAADAIEGIARAIEESLRAGGSVWFLGNGGSAADAQHLAGEFVGRFLKERGPYRAAALTTDTSVLTALANDYGFERVFERQVAALVRRGDVVVGLSTSGDSPNVVRALRRARALGAATVALTGRGGGAMAAEAEHLVAVDATSSPRIQECHIAIGHIVAGLVEEGLAAESCAGDCAGEERWDGGQ